MLPIGNDSAREAMAAAMASAAMHHAWLIAGPQGVGKGSFARESARKLLSQGRASATEETEHQIAAGAHPRYRELFRL
ncbi:MAG: DNA polymerase III subunit delta', partial [Sphingomonadales bacterium]